MAELETVRVRVPGKLAPVFTGEADYRCSWGGRGSAKTRTFAKMAAVWGLKYAREGTGVIVCGREFQNSLDESSLAEVKAAILSEPWLAERYDVGERYVRTRCGRVDFAFAGLRHNLPSIKSKSNIRLLWVDEGEPVSEHAWSIAIPTVREEGSEVWVTWNPEREESATNQRFRISPPPRWKGAEMNWTDNPWFPDRLDRARLADRDARPEQYAHIWGGDYVTVVEGAYYSKAIAEAREQGRIGFVNRDPLMAVRAYWDIGGTGARADATSIVVCQFVGREIRVLDYYEAVGQELGEHLHWLRSRGWERAGCVLPHDGANHEKVYRVTYESEIKRAGFDVRVVRNQGPGAASLRIEAVRRRFPQVHVNEATTEGLMKALGWYHEKRDENRGIGLGPEHDWCFAAGTRVLTAEGWTPIEAVKKHNEVLTPCGRRAVSRTGIVRWTDEWTTVKGISCTPEHRFFTSRGLVEAGDLRRGDAFWTRENWGLRTLGCLSAALSFGFMAAIISATRGAGLRGARSSFTGWCIRILRARYRKATRSIISTITRTTTIPRIWRRSLAMSTAASTSRNPAMSASAGCAARSSVATRGSGRDAPTSAGGSTTRGPSGIEGLGKRPAYSLTVERDHCYFVRGEDGKAYLVANSSHAADAFGLMCVDYGVGEKASGARQPIRFASEWA